MPDVTDGADAATDSAGADADIQVMDGLARHSSTITAMTISPSFAIGHTVKEHKEVLLPFFTCNFRGTFGVTDDETPVRAILTFDNVAFLLKRAGEEYVEALDHFAALSKGGIAPSRPRLEFTQRWLEEGAAAMIEAARRIGRLVDDLDQGTERADPTPTLTAAPSTEGAKSRTRGPRQSAATD